jgi:hypothetical protein
MRLAIESLLAVVAFFGVMAAINYNEQYADMVAKSNAPQWISVKFNGSNASVQCVMKGEVCDARL